MISFIDFDESVYDDAVSGVGVGNFLLGFVAIILI